MAWEQHSSGIIYTHSYSLLVTILLLIALFVAMAVRHLQSLVQWWFSNLQFHKTKLIRYNKALHRFHIAANIVKEEIVLFLVITSIFIFLSSAGIYYFENEAQPETFSSIFHSAWWSIVTLTTVGYGDVYPITAGGKIFTFFILIIGVGIVTIPAGLVATALTKAREIEKQEIEESKALSNNNSSKL